MRNQLIGALFRAFPRCSTPLHLALRSHHTDVGVLLVQNGAFLDLSDIYSTAPISLVHDEERAILIGSSHYLFFLSLSLSYTPILDALNQLHNVESLEVPARVKDLNSVWKLRWLRLTPTHLTILEPAQFYTFPCFYVLTLLLSRSSSNLATYDLMQDISDVDLYSPSSHPYSIELELKNQPSVSVAYRFLYIG